MARLAHGGHKTREGTVVSDKMDKTVVVAVASSVRHRLYKKIVRRLRRTDFEPPPRVDSVVLWLARRTRPLVEQSASSGYQAFVESCFGRSGQTVGRCLRSAFTRHQIRRLSRDLGFDPSAPPSGLSFDQWLGLFRFRTLEDGWG